MKEHPIIESSDSVRAILDGRKTQTRRIVDWKKIAKQTGCTKGLLFYSETFNSWAVDGNGGADICLIKCPYGKVGDKLWVRESFWNKGYWKTDKDFKKHWFIWPEPEEKIDFYYDADGEPTGVRGSYSPYGSPIYLRKHPSIHMKKEYARIWLEITGVRVERVQDINYDDTIAEGYSIKEVGIKAEYHWFKDLWDSINKKRGFSWKKNPWVWVIEFKKA